MQDTDKFDELMLRYDKVCEHYLKNNCVHCPFSPSNNAEHVNCRELLYKFPELAKELINKSYNLLELCENASYADVISWIAGPDFRPQSLTGHQGCAGFPCPSDVSCEQCSGYNFWGSKFNGSVELDEIASTLVIKIKLPGGNNE